MLDLSSRVYRPSDRDPAPFMPLGVPTAEQPVFRFRMGEYGWAYLDVAYSSQVACASLSDVFDPFTVIADWGQCVRDEALPVELAIHEEGTYAYLSVHPSKEPGYVALYFENDAREGLIECVCDHAKLVEGLRSEMRRFFESEFAESAWLPADETAPSTREAVLGHPFLIG